MRSVVASATTSLLDVVHELFTPGVSRSAARRAVATGGVRVNGRVERRPGALVRQGDRVDADEPRSSTPAAGAARGVRAVPATASPLSVVHEDAWLLIVDKPAGVAMHATLDPDRPHLHAMVEQLLRDRGVADPYVGIHHRLDRDTSGVVLFTIDRAANAGVARLFEQRRIEKRYVACVQSASGRRPAEEWTVRDHLGPVGRVGKTTRFGPVRAGGDPAHSDFRLLEALRPDRWLVEGRPHTGRTHQLRVHLAGGGFPIVGDRLYGGPPGDRVLLHAQILRFTHPLTGAEIEVIAPVPAELTSTPAGGRRRPRP